MNVWCPKVVRDYVEARRKQAYYREKYGIDCVGHSSFRAAGRLVVASGVVTIGAVALVAICYWGAPAVCDGAVSFFNAIANIGERSNADPKKPMSVYDERKLKFEPVQK